MKTIRNTLLGLTLCLWALSGAAQNRSFNFDQILTADLSQISGDVFNPSIGLQKNNLTPKNNIMNNSKTGEIHLNVSSPKKEPFFRNKRNLYSAMWAYASLNYLYADLVGFMDANVHAQYHTGVVDGTTISPEFLTVAAGFMQIPIANVFLPHIIKNENTLRWVQIASGTVMTLVQTATLFVGKPTPYYALFSGFEIAATAFITLDAIKWKTKKRNQQLKNGQAMLSNSAF